MPEQHAIARIILPLAVPEPFDYRIPVDIRDTIAPGMRAVVPVGKSRIYTGVVASLRKSNHRDKQGLKEIAYLLDKEPVITSLQLKLWEWVASYYVCTIGEVFKAALPAGMQAGPSGTREKYRPRQQAEIMLSPQVSIPEALEYMEQVSSRAPKQAALIRAYMEESEPVKEYELPAIPLSRLLQKAQAGRASLNKLLEHGVFHLRHREVSRFGEVSMEKHPPHLLTSHQEKALKEICEGFEKKKTVLLQGITSSGKTELYIHLIQEALQQDRQVLYLLPEIALTGQIIRRLKKHFPEVTGVYHSRLNQGERAEVWKRTSSQDYSLILGVRSSIFLPFAELGLIIVDEEHDSSYKQHDPAPRYHARDTAVMLAGQHNANILLGSATPALESYFNARSGKYHLASLTERFGKIRLPEFIMADTRVAYKRKTMVSHFAPEMIQAMDRALADKEQIVLFQNRRGFSPYLECPACGWIPRCGQCDVSLTYHKNINRLICHYCGQQEQTPRKCPNCSNSALLTRGFGTEKIEDEIRLLFPEARVERLDLDTTRKKNAFDAIIRRFEQRETDILIGTQMISKGLDFENLTVVGILSADHLLHFPDFRAHERSFQLMEQVAGRAGRKRKQGKVVIQTADPRHHVIRKVLRHDYEGMMQSLLEDRRDFDYPPFTRLIGITLKHKDLGRLNKGAERFGHLLRQAYGDRVLGPEFPLIGRLQGLYQKSLLIKVEKQRSTAIVRDFLLRTTAAFREEEASRGLRINVDIDPV